MTYAEAHEAARELGRLLGERQHSVIGQIRRIIQLCGVEFAREMYAATVEIEANGGMMLPDNSRRRSRGGVFFQLVRAKLDEDQQKQAFFRGAKPRLPLLAWKKRIELIQSLQTEQGQVKSMTVSLKGRPEQIEKRAEFVVITLSDVPTVENLPRGIPKPPSTPTMFVVYIALEQWQKVEGVITTSSEVLLIEGICTFDSESNSMMIFATLVQIEVLKTKPQKVADKPPKTKSNAES